MRNNVRTIMNVLEYYELHIEKQMVLVFLDAEKAFDNVNWAILLKLKQMEVGVKFQKLIQAIYTEQKTKIKINCDLSISILKRARQGFPLSPLLFILSRETH